MLRTLAGCEYSDTLPNVALTNYNYNNIIYFLYNFIFLLLIFVLEQIQRTIPILEVSLDLVVAGEGTDLMVATDKQVPVARLQLEYA